MHSTIMAGGGIVQIHDFILGSGIACFFAFLFVIAGRSLLLPLPFFQKNKVTNLGYYYFIGLCLFLVSINLFYLFKFSYTQSLIASVLLMLLISIVPYCQQKKFLLGDYVKITAGTLLWVFVIGYAAEFLLNVIAENRGGALYAEMSQHIVDSNSIPLLNRHHGQSVLASIVLRVLGRTDLDLAEMAVNLWLPLSQAFLFLIIYNLTENIFVKKINRLIVCFIAIAGNCAFSFLPYVPSDHDFPLICNLYADSVAGLGVAIIVLAICRMMMKNIHANIKQTLYLACLLYLLFTALNLVAELNVLVIAAALAPLFLISFIAQRNGKVIQAAVATLVVMLLAALSSIYMGGIFMPKSHVHMEPNKYKYTFDDSNANAAIGLIKPNNPAWWYVPYCIPGFFLDFGNYSSIFDGAVIAKAPLNEVFLHIKPEDPAVRDNALVKPQINALSSSLTVRAIYLAEMRFDTFIKVLFWPLLGFIASIWILIRVMRKKAIRFENGGYENQDSSLLTTKTGLAFSIFTFLIALGIIPFNSDPGDAVYWRWALTRFNEIGLFLMMIYLGIFSAYHLEKLKNPWVRIILTVALLGFLSAGVLVRVYIYPNLNG